MSFIWNGTSSDAIGFNVTSRQVYNAPAYDVNAVEVPGRSGNVLNPQNRFKNKVVSYTGFMRASDFAGATKREKISAGTRALKGWLLSEEGYHDLTDDYDPGFTRRGYVNGETAISDILDRPDGVELTITFNCEPFMYGPSESDTTITASSGTITNPNAFESYPLIALTMSGAGTLTVAGKTWSIASYTGTLYCDSNVKDWYDAGALKNSLVTGTDWPTLKPGSNTISRTGSISKIVITPRWRTL